MPRPHLPKILNSHFHFIWVVVFFIINGFNRQSQAIAFYELLFLFFLLIVILALFFTIANIFFKDFKKTGFFISITAILVLFFGVFQDAIGTIRVIAFFPRLPVFLSIVFATIIILVTWIKYSKRSFKRSTIYLNSLFLIYILVEVGSNLTLTEPRHPRIPKSVVGKFCDTCAKPDVYLIVLDEYFGSTGLLACYGFDNSAFELNLKSKGFSVFSNTRSNYNLTIFSIASMLNMDYLPNMGAMTMKNRYAYTTAMSRIESNAVCEKFKQYGYRISNQSRFDMVDAPSTFSGLMPSKIQLINSKTLYYKILKNLPFFLARTFRLSYFAEKIENQTILDNKNILTTALEKASNGNQTPTFAYLHLFMPHEPFAFDSIGRPVVAFWKRTSYLPLDKDNAYLQYLVYTNKKISDFLEQLMNATNRKAVILLMSDHGYRNIAHKEYKDSYQSLNAIYLPEKSTVHWYNGITNVNQFRVLFNTLFDSGLPLMKDSIVQ